MFSLTDLHSSAARVHSHALVSPQIQWPLLARRTGTDLWVKHENHLPTGAFKVRGGMVFADRQSREGNGRGLISATRGNHGQSLARAGSRCGLAVTIVVPPGSSSEKNRRWRPLGRS
jgi:threonine dehydratase